MAPQPYLFVAPAAILIIVLLVVPIIMVVRYSLYNNVITEPEPKLVGWSNYRLIFEDPNFWNAVKNTAVFTIASVLAHMVLGVAFAMLLNTTLIAGWIKAVFRVVFILPWLFTAAIIAILWRLMLDPSGVVNYLLHAVGLIQGQVAWFGLPHTAMAAIIVMNIWSGYPFFMLSLLAGLQGISSDLYEAAEVDGATGIRAFLNVTIPQLRPVIIAMAMLDLLWTTQQFTLIWMTTGGGPLSVTEVLSTYIYKKAFSDYAFSQASAAAVALLIFSLIVAYFYVRAQRRAE